MTATPTSRPLTPNLPEVCHLLMERSPVPIAELEGAGHIVRYVNPAFCRLVGRPREALVGNPFAATAHEGDACLAAMDRVYRTGDAETHSEGERPGSHPVYWSYAVWPVLGADHYPVGVMMQVTETTRFHQQAGAMNEALLLSSVHQHELTEAAETLNEQLQAEIFDRKIANDALRESHTTLQLQAEALRESQISVNSQRQALQLLAEGAPLDDVLGFLISVAERHSSDGMVAAITPLNEAGTHFQRGVGASLPDAFNAAVEGVAVSSPIGLCAHSVRRGEAVAVDDFSADTAWQPFGEFIAPYGLHSGWSVPIASSSGSILGTFANYYPHAGDPTPQNLELVHMVIRTAAIAIERRRAEEALRESEAKYRMLFEAIDEGFCIIEKVETVPGEAIDFRYLAANPAFAAQSGVVDVVGKTIREAFPGEPQEWFDTYDAILTTGKAVRFERDLVTQGRVLELYAVRVEDETCRRVAVIFADITERKQHEEHQKMLLNELTHRVKNTLATVQSIAVQTMQNAPTMEAFQDAFESRLDALAKTHNLLMQNPSQVVTLRDLVANELSHYAADDDSRYVIEGGNVSLQSNRAVAIGMLFHELATNAAKYGALSVPSGRVKVSWTVGQGAQRSLHLQWVETAGPAVEKPSRRGFGSRLIERGLAHELSADVRLIFDPAGVRCTMDIPLPSAAEMS